MINKHYEVSLQDCSDYKYTVKVYDDFTYITYYETNENGLLKETDNIELPNDYAVEIAKAILDLNKLK